MAERAVATAKAQESKQTCSNSCKRNIGFNSSGSPADMILQLQRTAGNHAVQKLVKSGVLQAKLRVGQPNDICEQEADRVAEQVMRMPEPMVRRQPEDEKEEEEPIQAKPIAEQITPLVQRQVEEEEEEPVQTKLLGSEVVTQLQRQLEEEEEEKEELLQTKEISEQNAEITPDLESRINAFRGGGQPLEPETRAFMESRFGYDFSHVRVHTDAKAAESADILDADAYTVGGDIIFGSGHYRPAIESGRQLIAHELSHVLQQGKVSIPSQFDPGRTASPLEHHSGTLSRKVLVLSKFRGAPVAATATTESHPHEIDYSIQSKLGVAARLIQRRRVPGSTGLAAAVPTRGRDLARSRTGLARVLSRAWGGLTASQKAAVRSAVSGLGITWTTETALLMRLNSATRAQLLNFSQAIRAIAPSAELGDPLLIDTGPRPATADAANIRTLVTRANTIFATIAGGTRDTDITQVFGVGNVAAVKTKYFQARRRMNQLRVANRIVTDRSGYSFEVGLGGLSDSNQIAVEPTVIDNPNDNESIIMLIHESMHAGNNDIDDFGYINQPSFTALAESVKLTNAAHFEIVPRRILGASHAFVGVTFIPAGTIVGGITRPPLTPREQAIRSASETFRAAWTVGLNLHTLFVRVFRNPIEWNTLNLSTEFGAPAGARFANTLPFWSNVEMLTIHTRATGINPAGSPAVRPITLIDIALSEGLIRKLSQGMDRVPQSPPNAQAFEQANATGSERTAAGASVNAERDLLIKLVIRVYLGSITGSVDRDERVVARMAQANTGHLSDILSVRPPGAFP